MRIPMNARTLDWIAAVGMALAGSAAVWGGNEELFRFSPGQSVFIHAETIQGAGDPVLEQRLAKRFLKKKTFTVTNKLSEADFVFLVYSEYRMHRFKKISSKESKW